MSGCRARHLQREEAGRWCSRQGDGKSSSSIPYNTHARNHQAREVPTTGAAEKEMVVTLICVILGVDVVMCGLQLSWQGPRFLRGQRARAEAAEAAEALSGAWAGQEALCRVSVYSL